MNRNEKSKSDQAQNVTRGTKRKKQIINKKRTRVRKKLIELKKKKAYFILKKCLENLNVSPFKKNVIKKTKIVIEKKKKSKWLPFSGCNFPFKRLFMPVKWPSVDISARNST